MKVIGNLRYCLRVIVSNMLGLTTLVSLTVAMMEMSSKMRKKVQQRGSMRIQSCMPETHSVSLTGWSCSKSDIARFTSGMTVLMCVLESVVWAGRGCWSELGGPGGEDIVDVRTDISSEEDLQVCCGCSRGVLMLMSCSLAGYQQEGEGRRVILLVESELTISDI